MQEEEITCSLHRVEGEEVAFWLLVEGGKGVWVSQGVEKDMVINFSEVRFRLPSISFLSFVSQADAHHF